MTFMKPNSIRKIFVGVAGLAVAVTLSLDFLSFRQINSDRLSGDWVEHTHVVIDAIDNFSIKLTRSLLGNSQEMKLLPNLSVLNAQASLIKDLTADNQDQQGTLRLLIQNLNSVHSVSEQKLLLWPNVEKLKQRELQLLAERHADSESNSSQRRRYLIYSTAVGGALVITLLLSLGWIDFRNHRRAEQHLETTVQSLLMANAELQLLSISKTNLIKSTVHDLKNPLGSIAGFADLIHDDADNGVSVFEMSAVVKRISEQTLELVGTMLQETALNEGKVALLNSPVKIADCVSYVTSVLQSLAKLKHQTISVETDGSALTVKGDQAKLRDVFLNLIGNAIKFSPKASSILVRSFRVNESVRVEVEDQGPGVKKSELGKLFTSGKSLSAKPTGTEVSTGFGLSIAKETIERHGGKIFLGKSLKNKGACFVVELPLFTEVSVTSSV